MVSSIVDLAGTRLSLVTTYLNLALMVASGWLIVSALKLLLIDK